MPHIPTYLLMFCAGFIYRQVHRLSPCRRSLRVMFGACKTASRDRSRERSKIASFTRFMHKRAMSPVCNNWILLFLVSCCL